MNHQGATECRLIAGTFSVAGSSVCNSCQAEDSMHTKASQVVMRVLSEDTNQKTVLLPVNNAVLVIPVM